MESLALTEPASHLDKSNSPIGKGSLLPVVYAFPSLIFPTIMFDICILWPIACQIIRSLFMDNSLYGCKYWAHYCLKPHGKQHWIGTEISDPVEWFTSGMLGNPLNPGWIRQLLHSIFCHFFLDLVEQLYSSAIDKAAQHTAETSFSHSGQLALFSPMKRLRFNLIPKFVM